MAELPGNIHEKIGDLRIEKGLTKKQVCEDLGLSASQLTRIENEEIKYFISLMDYAESYFSGSHDAGLMTRNELIDMAVSDLSEYLQSHPSTEAVARKDIRQLKAQKISGSEADLEKLNSIFTAILKDVKKEYNRTTPDISTAEMLTRIREMHQLALQRNQEKKLDEKDMAELTAQLIAPLGLNEKNTAAFKKLMEKILKNSL